MNRYQRLLRLTLLATVVAFFVSSASASAFVRIGIGIGVGYPPPVPVVREVVVPSPGPGFVWVAGHWAWRPVSARYTWVTGAWRPRPYRAAVWVGPRFGGGYFVARHWR
jgi:hypothetical protein